MALTWEEARPVIFTVANNYMRIFDFHYEIWELVNEIWASERLQKLSDIRLAYKAATYALVDFFRKDKGCFMRYGEHKPNPRKRVSEKSLCETDPREYQKICSHGDYGLLDSKDEVNFALDGISLEEKHIITMRLMGFTCKQIGRRLGGVSGAWISIRCKDIHSKLEKILKQGCTDAGNTG